MKINKKKHTSKYKPVAFATIVIVALVFFTATIAVADCPPETQKCQMVPGLADDAYIQNDYLGIAVHDTTSRFTLNNTGGDPANSNDDHQILLYGHPNPWSSFTTLRVDGSDYVFGSSDGTFTQVPTGYPTYIKSIWASNNIQITQTLQFATNPATGRVDVMQIRYMLENLDLTNSHNVGLRVLLDTMLGGNDGAPFYIPGTGAVTTEHEYTGASIPDYWVAFDDLGSPTIVSQGTFNGGETTVPDRVIFVSWPDFYNTRWDYAITPGKIFGSTGYPDSSVGLYWNPRALGAGQRIEYVTYYGLSGLTQSLMPPLTLSATGPLNLDVVNGAYNPNPFTVTAYVQNTGQNDINGVSVSINLPAGLSLEPGSLPTQTISLTPNQVSSVSWSVRSANQANENLFSYDVTATASGITERRVTRSVLVPALSLTYDTNFRSNPNGYQFQNFGIADINSWDFFRNTFGADEVEINGQHRPRATNFYDNSFRTYANGGSCFGMSSSSSILFQNSHDGWDLGLNRNSPLPTPNWPVFPTFIQTPTDWVEYYQLRWSDAAIQADRQINPTPNDAYNLLKQRMAGGNWIQNPLVLVMWWGPGHAIVPYRIEESADHQQANVRVYDNNFPGQERTVQFNLAANTVRDADYNGGNNLGSVEMIELSAIQSEPQMADYDTVTPSANLLYTDSEGNHLGYLNGEFKSEIDGAYLLKVPLQNENQNILETYSISNLDLKRELHGLTDGIAKVSVSRPNSLALADVQVALSSVDEIKVPVDGSNVEFKSGKGTSSLGLTFDRETAEFARVAHVDGFGVELGSAVQQLFSGDLKKAGFINKGAKKNYNLYLEQIGLNPGKYIHPAPIEIKENSANWLTPYNWDDLARTYVQLDEDFGNDGTIDTTKILTELQATIDIDPDTINLGSKGQYITAYIQLPVVYDVNKIDLASIQIVTIQGHKLSLSIGTVGPHELGDYNKDGVKELMVKFDRKSLTDILKKGSAEIEVIGKIDGIYFSGTDTVNVLNK